MVQLSPACVSISEGAHAATETGVGAAVVDLCPFDQQLLEVADRLQIADDGLNAQVLKFVHRHLRARAFITGAGLPICAHFSSLGHLRVHCAAVLDGVDQLLGVRR